MRGPPFSGDAKAKRFPNWANRRLSNVIQAQSRRRGDRPDILLSEAPCRVPSSSGCLSFDRSMGRKIRCKDAEEANFALFSEAQRLRGRAFRSGRGGEPAYKGRYGATASR
jgi:hypothetical protein